MNRRTPTSALFPYTTLFRSPLKPMVCLPTTAGTSSENTAIAVVDMTELRVKTGISHHYLRATMGILDPRSEEHTSELQSQSNLVCRLLLEKKNCRPT